MCVSCNVITCIGNEMLLQSAKKIFRLSNLAFNPPQFKFNILRAPYYVKRNLYNLGRYSIKSDQ